MNNDIKGMLLFLGLIGIGYAFLLVLLALFSGIKIIKSIVFIFALSSALISVGLTSQVKNRIFDYARALIAK